MEGSLSETNNDDVLEAKHEGPRNEDEDQEGAGKRKKKGKIMKKGKRRTRMRPTRIETNDNTNVIKIINQFEKHRTKLRRPKYRKTKRTDVYKEPLFPKGSAVTSLSAMHLLPRNEALIQAQSLKDLSVLMSQPSPFAHLIAQPKTPDIPQTLLKPEKKKEEAASPLETINGGDLDVRKVATNMRKAELYQFLITQGIPEDQLNEARTMPQMLAILANRWGTRREELTQFYAAVRGRVDHFRRNDLTKIQRSETMDLADEGMVRPKKVPVDDEDDSVLISLPNLEQDKKATPKRRAVQYTQKTYGKNGTVKEEKVTHYPTEDDEELLNTSGHERDLTDPEVSFKRELKTVNEEEPEDQQGGRHRIDIQTRVKPLYGSQIDLILEPYRQSGYLGCFASDEIQEIASAVNKFDVLGFVMNLDPSSMEGSHWVAVYIDFLNEKEVDYYDPLGDECSDDFLQRIKAVIMARTHLDYYLKLKFNSKRDQRNNSSTCGLFSAKFLLDRFNGQSFKAASGYDSITQAETTVRKLGKRFGYI